MAKKLEPPLRVLIVEDEALLSVDLVIMVEDAGHTVVGEAASLSEVEALPEAARPDLALVDIQLAEQSSGLDVAKHLSQRWPETRVVYVTANPMKVPADFGGACGAVAKPFSRVSMLSALNYVSEALCDPPPKSSQPDVFRAAPDFRKQWQMD